MQSNRRQDRNLSESMHSIEIHRCRGILSLGGVERGSLEFTPGTTREESRDAGIRDETHMVPYQ